MAWESTQSDLERALGGADVLTVNDLTGTGLKKVNANLAGFDGNGDGSADSVVLNGTAGADKIKMSSNAEIGRISLGPVDSSVPAAPLCAK